MHSGAGFAPHALMFAIATRRDVRARAGRPDWTASVSRSGLFVTVDLLWIGTLGGALLGAERAVPSQQGIPAVSGSVTPS
jgi:hypothetical protein